MQCSEPIRLYIPNLLYGMRIFGGVSDIHLQTGQTGYKYAKRGWVSHEYSLTYGKRL